MSKRVVFLPDGRLDELGDRPRRRPDFVRSLAGIAYCGERRVVAAETVVQDRSDVLGYRQRESRPSFDCLAGGGFDQLR